MRRKRKEHKFAKFMGKFIPYMTAFLMILGIAQIGTETKLNAASSSVAADSYNISTDQLSELYVVASLSNSFDLASIDTVAGSYVVASAMKEISQSSAEVIEKPSAVAGDGITPGVEVYPVPEGINMDTIAWRRGITNDQIRWSNGLKTTDLTVGQVLMLPRVPGIVYTVKSGDTADSLASKYSSSADQIIAENDLESSDLPVGWRIVLPGGSLPNTERPEYVAPVVNTNYNYSYTYSGFSSARENMVIVARGAYNGIYGDVNGSVSQNPMTRGQCTWYAWYWRAANGNKLPGGATLGNARSWAYQAAAHGFAVDKNPRPGDVFQTTAGYYGHVGIVLAVNGDGSLFVREMNLDSRGIGTLTEGTIPASAVGSFNYIH